MPADLLFRPPAAPFPQLRRALVFAERALNEGTDEWNLVALAIADEERATFALDALLASRVSGLGLRWEGRGSVVYPIGNGFTVVEAEASVALSLIAAQGDWSRVRRCSHETCRRILIDWSVGRRRRQCREHDRQV